MQSIIQADRMVTKIRKRTVKLTPRHLVEPHVPGDSEKQVLRRVKGDATPKDSQTEIRLFPLCVIS